MCPASFCWLAILCMGWTIFPHWKGGTLRGKGLDRHSGTSGSARIQQGFRYRDPRRCRCHGQPVRRISAASCTATEERRRRTRRLRIIRIADTWNTCMRSTVYVYRCARHRQPAKLFTSMRLPSSRSTHAFFDGSCHEPAARDTHSRGHLYVGPTRILYIEQLLRDCPTVPSVASPLNESCKVLDPVLPLGFLLLQRGLASLGG